MHEDSTAENPESKMYAFDAGARAIKAHYDRLGVPVEIEKGEYLGLYRTKFLWEEKPLISIIIPNKDHIDDLKRCIDSIEEKATYRNYEYVIVENNSTEDETFAYYKELEASNPKAHVVYWMVFSTILPSIISELLMLRVTICFFSTMIRRSSARTVWSSFWDTV